MVEKRANKGAKRVKDLRTKGMSDKQSKGVKGGVIAIIAPTGVPKSAGELLPYIEQKRN